MSRLRIALMVLIIAPTKAHAGAPYLVKDLPGAYVRGSLDFRPFWTTIGDTTWFAATEGDTGAEVWRTDGTPEGTVRVTNVIGAYGDHADTYLGHVNGRLIYSGFSIGAAIFALDEDANVPVAIQSIWTGNDPSQFVRGAEWKGYLYFVGPEGYPGTDYELWRTDGTASGTISLNPDRANAWPSVSPFVAGDRLCYFNSLGTGLYRSDGTPGNFELFMILPGAAEPNMPVKFGNKVAFVVDKTSPLSGRATVQLSA